MQIIKLSHHPVTLYSRWLKLFLQPCGCVVSVWMDRQCFCIDALMWTLTGHFLTRLTPHYFIMLLPALYRDGVRHKTQGFHIQFPHCTPGKLYFQLTLMVKPTFVLSLIKSWSLISWFEWKWVTLLKHDALLTMQFHVSCSRASEPVLFIWTKQKSKEVRTLSED